MLEPVDYSEEKVGPSDEVLHETMRRNYHEDSVSRNF